MTIKIQIFTNLILISLSPPVKVYNGKFKIFSD